MRVALGIGLLCLTAWGNDLEAARERFARQLYAFALRSGKEGLRGFRDRAYEALLIYEPDHKKARKTLRYRFNKKTQSWERKGDYVRPTDGPGVKRENATGRWQDMTDAYVAKVLPLLPAAKGAARRRLIDELLAIAPDHHGVRKENGEVRQGEAWVLAETPLARARRRALEEGASKLREKALPPRPQPTVPDDRRFGIDFPQAWQGVSARGLGTVPVDAVKQTVRVADAAYPILNLLFGKGKTPSVPFTFYLLKGGKQQATKALARHPAYTPADRRFALELTGSWVPGKLAFVTWDANAVHRTDTIGRQAIGLYMRHRFGITGKQGWAYEGVGLYANYLLCGTRVNTSALRTGYTQDEKALEEQKRGVKFSKADWVALAHKQFATGKPPDLRLLFAKDVNTLTADDLLVCYAIAAYLFECRPDAAAPLLTACGRDAAIDAALDQHLGVDLAGFERLFRRWLSER